MTLEEIEYNLTNWKTSLTNKQKRYIHFNSLSNFVFHFPNLPNERVRENALTYLTHYIFEIEESVGSLTSSESYEVATRYLNPLSEIYSSYLGFKSILGLKYIIVFSLIGDGVLYLISKDSLNYYLPIVSICLLTYYFSRKIGLEKKKKLFGLFY